ncbi:MAG: hypothetical protein WD232_02150 [Acidimicrobiales bacterium]
MTRARAVAVAAAAILLAGCGGDIATSAGVPDCEPSGELVTIAQAVPSARFVPCIETFPIGWSFGEMELRDGRARFWLRNDRVGRQAVRVTLAARCDTSGSTEAPAPDEDIRRSLRVDDLDTHSRGTWLHEFEGGCVSYDFAVPRGRYDFDAFEVELDAALDFISRAALAREVERRYDTELDPVPSDT